MMIAPLSRARREKDMREVTREYGGTCGEKDVVLNTGELCNLVSIMSQHTKKEVGWGRDWARDGA